MRDIRDGELILMENIIDAVGLPAFLSGVSRICHEKADHIRENWQDKQTASAWDRAGRIIEGAELHTADCVG